MASYTISDVEGIGPANARKLRKAGIRSVTRLLNEGSHSKGRREIARETGIGASRILKWVNMADLYRVKGIGSEYSQLLEHAGVDSVKELRNRRPDNLHETLARVNARRRLVRQLPSEKMVASWVRQASRLKPMVRH